MDFSPTYILESKTFPGVHIVLKRMGPRRRAEVELAVAAARARVRELSIRHESARQKLVAALDRGPKDAEGKPIEAELGGETFALALETHGLAEEASSVKRALIDPAFVRAAVKSFAGPEALTYEGAAATSELVIEWGPESFVEEIISAIENNAYLGAEAAANLQSPGISSAQQDSRPKSSTASAANGHATSSSESAAHAIPTT